MNLDSALSLHLPRLAARHRDGDLADAAYVAAYFLTWQIARYGRRFASRLAKSDPRPDAEGWLAELESLRGAALEARLIHWCGRYQFLSVIPNAPQALVGWLRDGWPLLLTLRVPTPQEVLRMQVDGHRPVTVIADYQRAQRPVLTKTDGFHFLVHDLEHAHKFFHDPRLHHGQRQFFQRVLSAVEAGLFEPYRADPVFASQFDYLASDMNTHPVHSLRYFCAVLIECLLRREGRGMKEALPPHAEAEMAELLRELGRRWDFPEAANAALLRLLRGGFGEVDAVAIERAIFG
ncbi:hypothetical protein [Methylomagnum sp.]